MIFAGSQPNAGNWVIQVGEAEGIFAEYRVDVEMIFSGSSTARSPPSRAGLCSAPRPPTTRGLLAHTQNDDLVYVAAGCGVAPYSLVVSPDVTSVPDIAGRTCSAGNAPNVGDGIFLQMMIEIESGGEVTFPDDYQIVNVPRRLRRCWARWRRGRAAATS